MIDAWFDGLNTHCIEKQTCLRELISWLELTVNMAILKKHGFVSKIISCFEAKFISEISQMMPFKKVISLFFVVITDHVCSSYRGCVLALYQI